MLLAGIFTAKQTQQKVMECSKIWSSIIRSEPIQNPLQTHNYFPDGFQQNKIAKFYGDVTLVFFSADIIIKNQGRFANEHAWVLILTYPQFRNHKVGTKVRERPV